MITQRAGLLLAGGGSSSEPGVKSLLGAPFTPVIQREQAFVVAANLSAVPASTDDVVFTFGGQQLVFSNWNPPDGDDRNFFNLHSIDFLILPSGYAAPCTFYCMRKDTGAVYAFFPAAGWDALSNAWRGLHHYGIPLNDSAINAAEGIITSADKGKTVTFVFEVYSPYVLSRPGPTEVQKYQMHAYWPASDPYDPDAELESADQLGYSIKPVEDYTGPGLASAAGTETRIVFDELAIPAGDSSLLPITGMRSAQSFGPHAGLWQMHGKTPPDTASLTATLSRADGTGAPLVMRGGFGDATGGPLFGRDGAAEGDGMPLYVSDANRTVALNFQLMS